MLVKKDLPWNYKTVIATVCRTLTLSGSLHGSLTKLMHSLQNGCSARARCPGFKYKPAA